MCTVSAIRLTGDRIRLACNRDEQRSRAAALPPELSWHGERRAVMPIDPVGGGTWIAVNDAGLAMALLNLNSPHAQCGARAVSRGRIIPSLIGAGDVEDAISLARGLWASAYGPFRLLIVDRHQWGEVISDGWELSSTHHAWERGELMRTSSGSGDGLVESPRRVLFDEMLRSGGITSEAQDAFHRHQWSERPALSVCMRRTEAQTVSYSVIEIGPADVRFVYHAAAPDEPAVDRVVTLDIREMAATR